jgi:hypothetical protein
MFGLICTLFSTKVSVPRYLSYDSASFSSDLRVNSNMTNVHRLVMVIFEKFVFFIGLNLVRKYGLNISWRKMVLVGSFLVMIFNSMYFLIIFDIWRDAWFYIFTDVR